MGTLKKFADRLAQKFDRPLDLDFKRVLEDDIISKRALLARREAQAKGGYLMSMQVRISCEELELVDISECCDKPLGCKVNRTVLQLPELLYATGLFPISKVSSLDMKDSYTYISPQRVGNTGGTLGTLGTMYTIKNRRLYVLNNREISRLSLTITPYDPRDLIGRSDCVVVSADCITPESDIIIEGHYEDTIEQMIRQSYGYSKSVEVETVNKD